jgi:hypothetical protein
MPIGREALDALRDRSLLPVVRAGHRRGQPAPRDGPRERAPLSTKGCYVGQEVIARLEGRGGNVNKALRGLRLTAPAVSGPP